MSLSEIKRRLAAIEQELSRRQHKIPTYEEWLCEWQQMDNLSRSVYEFIAEYPDYVQPEDADYREYIAAVIEYMHKAGVASDESIRITDIVRELEAQEE